VENRDKLLSQYP